MKHFDVACHLEGNTYGVSTFKRNYPEVPVHVGYEGWPVRDLAGTDFIYGNPPCACWSGNNPKAAKEAGTGWKTDPRLSCTRQLFSLLTTVRPKVWAWESVCLAPVRGKAFVDELTREAVGAGYSVSYLYHDAQYLGTPQTRKRWFMVCHRVEFTPTTPDFGKVITAGEALRVVNPRLGRAYDGSSHIRFDKELPKVPEGMRLRSYWEKYMCPPGKQVRKANGQIKGRCGFGHVRLRRDQPAGGTVGYAMVHPTEHRFLHINEVQALAGFPQDFDFGHTSYGAKELDLIARGVCPPVGEWLAADAARAVTTGKAVRRPKVVVYDFRKPGIAPVDVTKDFIKEAS
jgi:site-specific DNA-cytosine methylase